MDDQKIKTRLDVYLVKNNLIKSRNLANYLIKNKSVKVNDLIVDKPNYLVKNFDKVIIIKQTEYVSRAAYKLLTAIEHFKLDLKNLIVVDIGSSTGGFCQILLKEKVKKIYAIDVGHNQLDLNIKNHKKIVNLENTNFINIDNNLIKDNVDLITIDVSFISVKKIINKIISLKWKNWSSVILLKPQFEFGIKIKKTKGFVNQKFHPKIIKDFINFLNQNKIYYITHITSPITGAKKGNIEYLFYVRYLDGK